MERKVCCRFQFELSSEIRSVKLNFTRKIERRIKIEGFGSPMPNITLNIGPDLILWVPNFTLEVCKTDYFRNVRENSKITAPQISSFKMSRWKAEKYT